MIYGEGRLAGAFAVSYKRILIQFWASFEPSFKPQTSLKFKHQNCVAYRFARQPLAIVDYAFSAF